MRSLLTSCLWGGEKEKGAARKEDVEDCEALLDARHAPIWEPLSWEATLFSMAIVTSDAKEVLFKKRGLEPAAAGLLDQALLLDGTSHPLNAPLAQKEGVTPAPLSRNTCSFLTALLGPELEAVAVSTARRNRWWKGTISAKLPVQPVQDVAPVGSGVGASRSNPSMTQLRLQGPAPGSSAGCQERALPKRKPSLLEESMIRVSVRSEGTPADTMAAKATEARDRQGSAPMELCSADPRSSGDSSVKGEGRMEIKASSSSLRQDDGSKRVQWSCPEVGLAGTRSKSSPLSSPLDRINEGVPAIRMQIQSSPQASVHSPVMSAPIHRTVRAGRPAVRKSKSCLSQSNRGLVEEREEGEEEEEEGKHSPGSLFRGSSTRSKRGQKEGKLTVSRGPSFSRRSSLLLTPAIEHLVEQGGGTEEGATRTVALLKSLSQGAKNEARQVSGERPAQDFGVQCASAPSTRHQQLFDSVVRGTLSYSSVPSSEPPSNLSDMSNTVHAAAPHSAALPSSIQAHENMQGAEPTISVALSPFGNVSGSTNSNPPSAGAVGYSNRSVEGPHLLCQTATANSTEQRTYTSKPSTFPHSSHRASSSTVLSWETPFEDSNHPVGSANPLYQELLQHGSSSQLGAYQSTPLEPAIQTSPSASEDEAEIPTQSFDVMVTTLSEDARSPLLVSIFNCTEHWQVRATLTTLAEQQLELLSSLLPQHAIQFLALESTDAVPECVGQLARAHSDATLLFMDIVGFTSMSKNVKPVLVMVFLNKLFSLFDRLTDVHRVHKIETAGDCYIVGGGIISQDQSSNGFQCVMDDQDPAESAKQVMEFAKALLETAKQVKMPDTNEPVRVRVGLHTGDVVSGLIGSKMPKFSIFGDTMNTASRMESTGVPGRIHVSETTQRLLPHEPWESTGGVEVKGKGRMQTYLWVPPASSKPAIQQQVQQPLVHLSGGEPLPCSFIRQAKQAHTLLKQLGPAPNLQRLGRFNNEVFVAEPLCQKAT